MQTEAATPPKKDATRLIVTLAVLSLLCFACLICVGVVGELLMTYGPELVNRGGGYSGHLWAGGETLRAQPLRW